MHSGPCVDKGAGKGRVADSWFASGWDATSEPCVRGRDMRTLVEINGNLAASCLVGMVDNLPDYLGASIPPLTTTKPIAADVALWRGAM
jgi:hypothetical protein